MQRRVADVVKKLDQFHVLPASSVLQRRAAGLGLRMLIAARVEKKLGQFCVIPAFCVVQRRVAVVVLRLLVTKQKLKRVPHRSRGRKHVATWVIDTRAHDAAARAPRVPSSCWPWTTRPVATPIRTARRTAGAVADRARSSKLPDVRPVPRVPAPAAPESLTQFVNPSAPKSYTPSHRRIGLERAVVTPLNLFASISQPASRRSLTSCVFCL